MNEIWCNICSFKDAKYTKNHSTGLDHMNKITSGSNCTLRVHVEDFDGKTGYAEYKLDWFKYN